MSQVEVSALSVVYPGRPPVRALDGVDLTVDRSTTMAVLGSSGCGKTTLLRTLAGFERAAAGTISLDDRLVDGPGTFVAPNLRRVGIVPQEGALFPHLDVVGNIAYGLKGRSRAAARARVAELLDLVGLVGYERRRPRELSGGQQQRVALARALAPEPSIVLLDEPFTALDTALRSALRDEVVGVLRATGSTAILVTHDPSEALQLADRVAVMRAGRIVQVAPPGELYARPVDIATAELLGEANVVSAHGAGDAVECVLGKVASVAPVQGEVDVLIRPEQLVVGRRSNPLAGVAGVVSGVRFTGPDALIEVVVDGQVLRARQLHAAPPQVGDQVEVSVVGGAWPLGS